MITFLICLLALIIAYFCYGKILENVCDIDANNEVPSKTHYDGVDYIPLPRWRIFLIQLLNIAGLGIHISEVVDVSRTYLDSSL